MTFILLVYMQIGGVDKSRGFHGPPLSPPPTPVTYIMQNTMVRYEGGGGKWQLGEKNRFRGKNEKGERKTEENYIKRQ